MYYYVLQNQKLSVSIKFKYINTFFDSEYYSFYVFFFFRDKKKSRGDSLHYRPVEKENIQSYLYK